MSAKSVIYAVLLLAVVGSGAAHGQMAYPVQNPMAGGQSSLKPINPLDEPPAQQGGDDSMAKPPTNQPPGTLSHWIIGTQPACCLDPGGGDGPIHEELFTRTGISLPFGGGTFGKTLQMGYSLEAGARTLFFDPARFSAWTVEVSVLSIWNHAAGQDHPVSMTLLEPTGTTNAQGVEIIDPVTFGQGGVPGVTLKSLNRTFANLGIGREYYLWGAAGNGGANWRVGWDVGGRWGSEKATFSEIRHRVRVIEGAYLALHTDYEMPCGIFTFLAGFRAEYDYTWSEILQEQNNSDVMGINLMLNFGMRY